VVRFFKELTVFPGNMALGATRSEDMAFRQGFLSARQLKSLGIDINLAPVLDVITTYHNPGITIRSFGEDPELIASLGAAMIQGTQSAGVAACAKHFPGKGAALVDAHYDLPTVSLPQDVLEGIHLSPFARAIEKGLKAVMSTHVIYPCLHDGVPATLSQAVIQGILREQLGFEGVIFSDDFEMGAIQKHYPIEEASVQASKSGHDQILVCSDYASQLKAWQSMIEAYREGLLARDDLEASLERINALRKFCHEPSRQPESTGPMTKEADHLAEEIAERSLVVFQDPKGLIPVKGGDTLSLIVPDLSHLASIEDGFPPNEENTIASGADRAFPGSVEVAFVPLQPEAEDIGRSVKRAQASDLTVAFIFDAQGTAGQKQLMEELQRSKRNLIFVLLRNPFDIEFASPEHSYITTFGYRKVQIGALMRVLFEAHAAHGAVPFSLQKMESRREEAEGQ
jgi:beta-N-acetylhexosaminidase